METLSGTRFARWVAYTIDSMLAVRNQGSGNSIDPGWRGVGGTTRRSTGTRRICGVRSVELEKEHLG